MELLIFVLLLIILDLAALHWGVESGDEINSPEWQRRSDYDQSRQQLLV